MTAGLEPPRIDPVLGDLPPPDATPPDAAPREATAPDAMPLVSATAGHARTGNLEPGPSVAAMFDEIAPVYDRMNSLMTLGRDAGWRRAAVAASAVGPGDAVIDVACGTGKLAEALAERVGPFGRVVAVDLAPRMIAQAIAHHQDLVQLEFQVGDALALSAGDGSFDAATIAFGLRNLADFAAGFRELARVVRPGGRVVCLELSVPRPRLWGRTYHAVFRRSAPLLGSVFGRRDAYRYLPTSLDGFPDPDELVRTMLAAGLTGVSYRRLGLGSVALHQGSVPR